MAFLDIYPTSIGHTLVAPKKHSCDLTDMDEETARRLFAVAKKIAPRVIDAVRADAFNLVMNNGAKAGQVIMHPHLHIIPRFDGDGLVHWPAILRSDEQLKEDAEKIIKNI
jgi:histidine triad (HIT) family protein